MDRAPGRDDMMSNPAEAYKERIRRVAEGYMQRHDKQGAHPSPASHLQKLGHGKPVDRQMFERGNPVKVFQKG